MKWTIQELAKIGRFGFSINEMISCDRFLAPDDPDILSISDVHVEGSMRIVNREERFEFSLRIQCTLTMPCAITLEPLEVPLDFETELAFATKNLDDFTHKIDGITLDLDPYIFAEILVEKPYRVTSEHAYDHYQEENIALDPDEVAENNPFAALQQKKHRR
ncbi:MAG: DUF177 domain-containing protein [Candidatus Izemoplasmatales bacterium]